MAPTNNEPIASGTATDTEHVSNIDPALASELDLPPSPAKDHHNHTDDAEGESEVEAEDERDQLGNESEISSPPTPSPPPPSTRKTAPSTSSDKDKGTSGTPAKITRVFQACEHCKKRKCRVSWDFFLCNLCSFFFERVVVRITYASFVYLQCDGVQPTCKVCMRLGIQCVIFIKRPSTTSIAPLSDVFSPSCSRLRCVYAPERRMRGYGPRPAFLPSCMTLMIFIHPSLGRVRTRRMASMLEQRNLQPSADDLLS